MFQARAKYTRRDKNLIPFPCVSEGNIVFDCSDFTTDKPIGTCEIYGESRNSFGEPIELLCVTLTDGTKIPACRLKGIPGNPNGWAISQLTSLKLIPPQA